MTPPVNQTLGGGGRGWGFYWGVFFNPSDVIVLLGTRSLRRSRPRLCRALAGLPEPSQGSPGRPRHRQRRPPSPEERATPSARTGALGSQLSRHAVSAAVSPVPVGRLAMPLRLVGPFDRSNGPCEGQRAVPKPVRLMRRLSLASPAAKPARP